MVLQITAFREEIRASDVRPRVHLIVIEEPEVHLHPQVQSVFTKRITEFIRGDGGSVDAQVMLTTHSPHVVADSGFAPVRYFRRRGNTIRVRDLLTFKAEREKANDSESVRFLTQYLTQTRCDILFADKAILIEGQVERLLLPIMMGKCATGPAVTLLSEYVSVIEIGGAHAHLFRGLLEFLEVPTLIVTDLDSVGSDKKRCRVAEGESTSNQTLKTWLPGKADLAVLHAATAVEKTEGRIQVAYQVPERDGLACGRTFEEAFVYCNADWLLANRKALSATVVRFDHASATALREQAFDLTLDKVDFALDLMTVDGWTTPKYIADGLRWLAEQDPYERRRGSDTRVCPREEEFSARCRCWCGEDLFAGGGTAGHL
ncbi:MAG: AAA family ATPase [Thermoanaerobaculia bacterium]|nr:AAA family ATPase [Thermoanaerobaculia bacterium]